MTFDPGHRIGPYEIVALVGAGGMGEVYRARDPRLGRDVAVKVLAGSASGDADRRRRFEQEARAVAALSHPNVLAIFDVGVTEVPYLVTELLDGEALRAHLDRGPLDVPTAFDVALQLAAGLGAAHDRGIVHRDLKPENIFITGQGQVKVLDFGLAKQMGPSADGTEALTRVADTAPGTILGTLAYMAPEQIRGQDADHRADLFACGAILFEMVTGRRAFHGGSPADTIAAILHESPAALAFAPGTPPGLARLVRQCLQKHPDDRPQSARDFARALEFLSDSRSGTAPLSRPVGPTSVAVLPFANLSADPDGQYFSDGLAEELVNALARVSGLRVASRTSSFRFRALQADVRQIGRELEVGAIVEGSVRRSGARLRITVQLTNADDGYHLWSERYDREMADVFDLQDEIVQAIVQALVPALVGEAGRVVRRSTENLAAYDLYLRGRHFWNQRAPNVLGTAITCFEQAIALDPRYALAHAGLADCYSILRVYGWTPADHSQPRALQAITDALALDPGLAEAHFAKALYVFCFERHWREARPHFDEALRLSPRTAMFEAYLAMFLATEYRHAEAGAHLERAVALDPHSALVQFLAASTTCVMGDAEATGRHVARALALQPESLGPRWPQTVALLMSGRYDEAIALGEQIMSRTRAPIYLGVLGMVYGLAGRVADARRLGQELEERRSRGEYIVPAAPLSVQLGLGDVAGVRAALAACVDGGAAPFSVISTGRWLLDGYRTDPECGRLLDALHDGASPEEGPPTSAERS